MIDTAQDLAPEERYAARIMHVMGEPDDGYLADVAALLRPVFADLEAERKRADAFEADHDAMTARVERTVEIANALWALAEREPPEVRSRWTAGFLRVHLDGALVEIRELNAEIARLTKERDELASTRATRVALDRAACLAIADAPIGLQP